MPQDATSMLRTAPHATPGQRAARGMAARRDTPRSSHAAASDIFLGHARVDGIDGRRRDFYVRQLRDRKGRAEPEDMAPAGMRVLGEVCGTTLARAHARSGDRIAIAACLGRGHTFDRALTYFAEKYADQNARDHRALVDAVRTGRLPSAGGV